MYLGFLLTTSPTIGLNYSNIFFEAAIKIAPDDQTAHQDCSALENIRRRWDSDGTTSWPSMSVHWLMISLIIELEVTPHNDLSRNVPDIQNAYLPIVRDLVSNNPPVIIVAYWA